MLKVLRESEKVELEGVVRLSSKVYISIESRIFMINREKVIEYASEDTKEYRAIYEALCDLTEKHPEREGIGGPYFESEVVERQAGYKEDEIGPRHRNNFSWGSCAEAVLDKITEDGLAQRILLISPPCESFVEVHRFGYRAINQKPEED